MARVARGSEKLEWGREVLARAQTVEQLRQAQAVVLPLDYGLSLEQTAPVIGRSVPWTCRLRNRFLAGEIVGDGQRIFVRAWSNLSEVFLEHHGSLGSRLHKGPDNTWYSYAQWPSEATRDNAFALPSRDPKSMD